jgi:hypothetical protein
VEALLATWPEHPDVVAMKDVVREALMRD